MKYTIDILKEKKLIIFSAIIGSHAYGTALPTSDTDIRGVYIQPLEDILSFDYVDQVADKKNDIVFYEIKRFLELLSQNNPNILELFNVPEDCIQFKDPIFDLILEHKDKFITKQCKNSFAGYAIAQIKRAKSLNKKINWEESQMTRKGVLDFCYVIEDNQTIALEQWLEKVNEWQDFAGEILEPKHIGLAKIDHAHDLYAMYDLSEFDIHTGIVSEKDANDVQLTSIPKGIDIAGYLTFNKDAYYTHCKRYAEYKEWLEHRNEDRFKMNKEHGKQYDSKNMAHTYRLLNMASEIADGKINVRRPSDEIATLMQIRRGELDYEELVWHAEQKIKIFDELFEKSNIPDKVDPEFVNELLIKIRKTKYTKL